MQRAALPEPHGRPRRRRHRRSPEPDRILLGLKIGTFLAAGGLIGVIILLATGESNVADRAPTEQRIGAESRQPDDAPPPLTSRPAAPPTVLTPPTMRTQTANIAGPSSRPPEPAPAPPPAQRSEPAPEVAVLGEPCPQVGTFALTRNREPVMCYPPSGGGPSRWNRVF
jgi:hypothetical protein